MNPLNQDSPAALTVGNAPESDAVNMVAAIAHVAKDHFVFIVHVPAEETRLAVHALPRVGPQIGQDLNEGLDLRHTQRTLSTSSRSNVRELGSRFSQSHCDVQSVVFSQS